MLVRLAAKALKTISPRLQDAAKITARNGATVEGSAARIASVGGPVQVQAHARVTAQGTVQTVQAHTRQLAPGVTTPPKAPKIPKAAKPPKAEGPKPEAAPKTKAKAKAKAKAAKVDLKPEDLGTAKFDANVSSLAKMSAKDLKALRDRLVGPASRKTTKDDDLWALKRSHATRRDQNGPRTGVTGDRPTGSYDPSRGTITGSESGDIALIGGLALWTLT